MTPETAQQIPEAIKGKDLPDVLLSYQQRLLGSTALNQVTVCEKSRRIGITWAIAGDAVLTSATARSEGGMDTLYIGYNLDMAREFIDACAMWAKAFNHACDDVDEFIFKDSAKEGDKDIQAFRVKFASGFEITALSSRPRSLRGRQGYVIIDEAAFHDELDELLKAAMALLMWGGKVLVISTHNGDTNAFNTLVQDVRKKRKPYNLIRIDFDDALADGLYERIKLTFEGKGVDIAPKEKWRQGMIDFYGDDADEELFCIPAEGTGTAIPGALIEARMAGDIPVLRWEKKNDFVQQPPVIREADANDWLEETVRPHLEKLDPALESCFGEDFGRVSDLTCIWPVQVQQNLVRRAPFVVELRNIPFAQQRQILFYIVRRLPRLRAGAMDAGGNGAQLAEETADEFGPTRIHQVKFSVEWYRENMPSFVAAFEDGMVLMPRDADVLSDHRLLKKIDGVVRVPTIRAKDAEGKPRHGDSAIAHALAWFASNLDVAPIEFQSTGQRRAAAGAFAETPGAPSAEISDRGFGTVRGGDIFRGY